MASAAGCTDARDPQTSQPASPVKYERVTCTVGTVTVRVDTYPSARDQDTAEGALVRYLGSGKYASGEGWVAVDSAETPMTAQIFAQALGGSVKGA